MGERFVFCTWEGRLSGDIVSRLSGLADPFPYKDGFHLGLRSNNTAVEREYGEMLYGAMLDKKPATVVEVGTASGYSASWILAGLNQNEMGHLWTVDPAIPNPAIWSEVGVPLERLTFINGLLREVLDQLPPQINLLFHDAGHSFDEVIGDIEILLPRIPVQGIILIHDVRHYPQMGEKLAAWFDAHPEEWSYQEISSASGMGIAIRTAIQTFVPGTEEPAVVPKPKAKRKSKTKRPA